MLKRTTNYLFQPYGDILYSLPHSLEEDPDYSANVLELTSKTFDTSYVSNSPVYISCERGIVLLAVSDDGENFERFVVHRHVKLHPHVYFNFASISESSSILMNCISTDISQKAVAAPFEFQPTVSRLHVNEILTTYFQVRKGNYVFPGEAHPYYELIYVDHGNLEMTLEGVPYSLEKYDLILYYPNQFHTQFTREDQNCSYLTIIFSMEDEIDDSMKNRIFHARKDIYSVLCRFMKAVQTEDYLNQELSILYLKEILILLHQFDFKEEEDASANPMQQHYENTLLNEILVYINNNIYNAFTVEDLCAKFSISRSTLQNLFRTNIHISPKQYISNLKLSQAKILIQEHKRTISEISDMLGFTSIHYFSRKFKKQYGLSPTDYSKSIHP